MSPQNQALQVALILFVILALVLGVTAFVFFAQYHEARAMARIGDEEANSQRAVALAKQAEINELKGMLGLPATASPETAREQFHQDMRTCASSLPEQTRSYRQVLLHLQGVIRSKNLELDRNQATIQSWRDLYEQQEPRKIAQVDRHREAAVQAGERLLAVQSAASQEQGRINGQKDQMHQVVLQARRDAQRAQTEADQRFRTLQKQHRQTVRDLEVARRKLDAFSCRDSLRPDGTIRGVNYRLRRAWVDLGWADALPRLLRFDVYPADADRLARPAQKGQIEVSRILDAHLAEARVTDEQLTNPIIRGDQVAAPRWDPGRR
jgi:hypothetical protein